jgi:hypothetical protein
LSTERKPATSMSARKTVSVVGMRMTSWRVNSGSRTKWPAMMPTIGTASVHVRF